MFMYLPLSERIIGLIMKFLGVYETSLFDDFCWRHGWSIDCMDFKSDCDLCVCVGVSSQSSQIVEYDEMKKNIDE